MRPGQFYNPESNRQVVLMANPPLETAQAAFDYLMQEDLEFSRQI
jgi:hypothetical protein